MPDSPPDIALQKAELRQRLRFRRAHHVDNLIAWERNVCFSSLPSALLNELEDDSVIALYVAIGPEPNLNNIATALTQRGHTLALPRIGDSAGMMDFAAYHPGDTLDRNALGIDQPGATAAILSPTLILCPLLGFDRALWRIGQGGGYYDRAFARYPAAKRIGVAWSIQEEDAIPDEPHDMPLDAVMTEAEWIMAS